MSSNVLQKENFSITLEYYDLFQNFSKPIISFIKEYRKISIDYNKKIKNISNVLNNKLREIKEKIKTKKKTDLNKIFSFITTIPKILDLYIENLDIFLNEMEKEVKSYEENNGEIVIPTFIDKFEKSKKELLGMDSEIKRFKNNFMEEMTNTEQIIYKYYYLNDHKKSDEQPKNPKNKDKNSNNIITKDYMNNSINVMKQMENAYKSKIGEGNNMEKEFIKNTNNYSESVKSFTNKMFQQLKHLILNFLVSLKNNFKIPFTEIEQNLPDLLEFDKSLNMETMIQSVYHDNKYKNLFNVEKYNLQVLNSDQNNNKVQKNDKNIFNEIETKVSIIGDGYGKLTYIEDEYTFLTLKKMLDNFELIKCNMNLDIEKEKLDTFNLSSKLLSNLKREKNLNLNEPEVFNMSEVELKTLYGLLVKHHNIIVFLQQMNRFRSKGIFVMLRKTFDVFGKIFNSILNIIEKDKDIYSGKNIIILSQTYFYKDSKTKEYLQMKIINNKLLKTLKFWEDLFKFEMDMEIEKLVTSNSLDYTDSKMDFEQIREINRKKYGKLAFGLIMTLANNMIDFGISPKDAYEVIKPKIKYYDLDNATIEAIKTLLKINNEEEDKKENILINENEEKVEKKDNDIKNEIKIDKNEIKDNVNKNEIKNENEKKNENKNEINKNENEKQEKNKNIINIDEEE